jgi:hypothetical protein
MITGKHLSSEQSPEDVTNGLKDVIASNYAGEQDSK